MYLSAPPMIHERASFLASLKQPCLGQNDAFPVAEATLIRSSVRTFPVFSRGSGLCRQTLASLPPIPVGSIRSLFLENRTSRGKSSLLVEDFLTLLRDQTVSRRFVSCRFPSSEELFLLLPCGGLTGPLPVLCSMFRRSYCLLPVASQHFRFE